MSRPGPLPSLVVCLLGVFLGACAAADGAEGPPGPAGASVLTRLVAEPVGARCASGGQALVAGVDADGDGVLTDGEITSTTLLCDGAAGASGSAGATGAAGATGDAGATPSEAKLGVFTPNQLVAGMIVACSNAVFTDTNTTCVGIQIAGVPMRFGTAETTAMCAAITGQGVQSAIGSGTVTTFAGFGATGWTVTTNGSVQSTLNVTCFR